MARSFGAHRLSSVAYATEEILLILAFGGAQLLHLAWYIAAAIVVLLVVVISSYRQTCYAYPNGGGAFRSGRLPWCWSWCSALRCPCSPTLWCATACWVRSPGCCRFSLG